MRILFVGDVVGRSGRTIVYERLPGLIRDWKLDLVVVNGENAAGGFGITESIYREFIDRFVMLARRLRGFEDCHAGKIARLFVRNKATITIDKQLMTVSFPRRAHNPILRAVPWATLPMQHPLDSSMKLQLEFQ